jgi:hypothetical protein
VSEQWRITVLLARKWHRARTTSIFSFVFSMWEVVNWIPLAQNREKKCAFVNTVMDLQVPQKREIS